MTIHSALLIAMEDIAKKGIAKTLTATLGMAKVNYRGIEAAMNEMSGVLIRAKITVVAEYSDLQLIERAKAEGKATRFVILKGAFKFIADDQSFVTFTCYGEAMDSGDKATVKAQSVAFRTALFQTFVVPTMAIDPEVDGDGDEDPFAAIFNGIESQDTDAKALAYWNEHSKSMLKNPTEYTRFKNEVVAHRKAMKEAK